MTNLPIPVQPAPSSYTITGNEIVQLTQGGVACRATLSVIRTWIRGGAVPTTTGPTYDDYFKAFAARETRGVFDPTLTPVWTQESGNSYPALGAYQFDKNALIAVNYYTDDGNLSGLPWVDSHFTGLDGITSKAAFLNSPPIQTKAAKAWNQAVGWPGLQAQGCPAYIGQTIGGIRITAAALLGGTSLLGPTAVKNFLTSNGTNNPTDSYGTSLASYMTGLGGYPTPFDPA